MGQPLGQLSGGLTGLFKTRKSTGQGENLLRGLGFQRQIFNQAQEQASSETTRQFGLFGDLAGKELDIMRRISPTFAGIEERVTGDLASGGRDPALEKAFTQNIRSGLAARGVLRSPRSAFQESLPLLQFQEQQRQQSLQNAFGFLGAAQPRFTQSLLGGGGVQSGFGFDAGLGLGGQRDALREQKRQDLLRNVTNVGAGTGGLFEFAQGKRPTGIGAASATGG